MWGTITWGGSTWGIDSTASVVIGYDPVNFTLYVVPVYSVDLSVAESQAFALSVATELSAQLGVAVSVAHDLSVCTEKSFRLVR